MNTNKTLAYIATAAFLTAPALAQRGGPDWTTTAGDPQRTSWVRVDHDINAENEGSLGIQKLWALKMAGTEGKPSEPIMISTYIGYRGFKALAVVTGPNYLYTADYDLGRFYYDEHYKSAVAAPACMVSSSAVGKLSSLTPVAPREPRESNAYHTVTGQPHQGVPLDEAMGGQLGAGGPRRPAAPAQALPPGIRFAVPIFLVTSDGMAHAITFDSGKETYKPVRFLPSGSVPSDLIVVQDTLYAATMPGCGSSPNQVFAMDVSTPNMRPTGVWKGSGKLLGPPAFNKEGTLFVSTEKGVYSLKPKTLEETLVAEAPATSTPVVITDKNRDRVVVGTKDGIEIMDATGASATPVKASVSGFTPTALATWDDKSGTHWILATDTTKASGAIHAFKVTDNGLEPGWTSTDMASPARPIIVDGIVFALASGADRTGDPSKPVTNGTHATLYALDAMTGKEVWNSGSDITSFVGSGGLAFNEGQVFLATHDNMLYSFGKPEPHQ